MLAISSFKHDDNVMRLLEGVIDAQEFERIVVVDSLGTGKLPVRLSERGWQGRVAYVCAAENLGSAGNLAKRLEWSAATGADFAYCVNHDGQVDLPTVRVLLEAASKVDRCGAAYPLKHKVHKGGRWDAGAGRIPLPFVGKKERPTGTIEVKWASSNGALYGLAPVRDGIAPWADLWMGWEDLGYGWWLDQHGWTQIVVTDAEFEDPQEYAAHKVGPWTLYVTDKPAWYAYYQVRNLILVARRTDGGPAVAATVAGRIGLELAITTALRPDKRVRYGLLARGLVDGLRGRTGKWRLP